MTTKKLPRTGKKAKNKAQRTKHADKPVPFAPVDREIARAAERAGIRTAEVKEESRKDLLDALDGLGPVRDRLLSVWCAVEELAAEANASISFARKVDLDTTWDEVEDLRRKAVEHLHLAAENLKYNAERIRDALPAEFFFERARGAS